VTAKRKKLLQNELSFTREDAAPVIKKFHKPGKVAPDRINGLFQAEVNGKPFIVEYEPDTALRDTEQIPLLEEGGVDAFFNREVLPYTPDAWIDPAKTVVGYEISFTRHFYKPVPMRTLDEIKADIYALKDETEGLLEEIVGEVE
jgi:type I restriction enzyme M protein